MLNLGDEVVWLGPSDSTHFTHGKIYKIVVNSTRDRYFIIQTNAGMTVTQSYEGIGTFWSIVPKVKKVKLPAPKNDIEWLDRVQQNFKE